MKLTIELAQRYISIVENLVLGLGGVVIKEPIYYKVVRRDNNKSFLAGNSYEVKYEVGFWTTPILEGSKLFIFDTLENVNLFLRGTIPNEFIVYTCHAKNVSKAEGRTSSIYSIGTFWKDSVDKRKCDWHNAPTGSLWADEVMLLEEVK